MKRVLEDLYFGETQPKISNYDNNPRLKKQSRVVEENQEILMKLLDGKERKLFLDIVNAQSEIDGTNAVEDFINGFKLGAKIIVESIIEP